MPWLNPVLHLPGISARHGTGQETCAHPSVACMLSGFGPVVCSLQLIFRREEMPLTCIRHCVSDVLVASELFVGGGAMGAGGQRWAAPGEQQLVSGLLWACTLGVFLCGCSGELLGSSQRPLLCAFVICQSQSLLLGRAGPKGCMWHCGGTLVALSIVSSWSCFMARPFPLRVWQRVLVALPPRAGREYRASMRLLSGIPTPHTLG